MVNELRRRDRAKDSSGSGGEWWPFWRMRDCEIQWWSVVLEEWWWCCGWGFFVVVMVDI